MIELNMQEDDEVDEQEDEDDFGCLDDSEAEGSCLWMFG